ncbi:MAG: bifunctional diaminohydroxyphosphoribosylaminopyrimidine deaminase/5-amino-6-(5-phosphoribosylamino)uracil reductase RibD [Bacteroidota bacterium]|nr:bifunctional diaminohydroxyphosphoribosylaminopyrimidine deaminase/5-amino-6-(5-phosphoribosylamino)uracil reductase RibD [Bacteroidota bacterium]
MIEIQKDNSPQIFHSGFQELYMSRCLQLAQYGGGYVAPNPMVGAVLTCDGRIIGEGYHRRFGEEHAEPNAIRSVKDPELLKRATLYVSLEPCSYYGKTPPCADLIVSSHIPRVVIGTLDPNPKVSGMGVAILRKAGVEVTVGVLEDECRELNKRFFIFQEQKRPYVLLKWAQTQDGFIDKIRTDSSEKPLLISNNITKQLTHRMRSENQAILVGANTVLLDNPSLTVRNWSGKSPIRIAIDRQGRIPRNYNLLDGSIRTLIFTEKDQINKSNVEFIKINFDADRLKTVMQKIYERNIHSVLVEGGASILNSFIEAGLWDEANIEVSTQRLIEGVPAPNLHFQPVSRQSFEGHEWLFFKK